MVAATAPLMATVVAAEQAVQQTAPAAVALAALFRAARRLAFTGRLAATGRSGFATAGRLTVAAPLVATMVATKQAVQQSTATAVALAAVAVAAIVRAAGRLATTGRFGLTATGRLGLTSTGRGGFTATRRFAARRFAATAVEPEHAVEQLKAVALAAHSDANN
jgi:hypothetical protein